jgi:phosphoadenosine phosphosulfate reductase
MLLPSPRHTPADLTLWAELEEADRLWYTVGKMEIKALRAMTTITEFATAGPCVLMTSWGKDATVTACLGARLKIPFVHIAQPDADPTGECDAVAAAFLSAFPGIEYHVISVPRTGTKFVPGKPTPELLAGIEESRRRFQTDRWINGLRKAERGGRQFRPAAVCGISCAPIFDWSTAAVFAFLAHHDLPVHPRYAMLGGGRWPRERLRVCTFNGFRGTGGGRTEWEQEYYGDVVRRSKS